jgi:hypothetical protein
MIYISHRGNIDGKNISKENSVLYILQALDLGFDVEIDVWFNNGFWLGHDRPAHFVDYKFLENTKLWCHAKNIDGLYELSKINTRYFWHQNDNYTLTSDNIIWAYPGQILNDKCVCVLPEQNNIHIHTIDNCYGICSDFIRNWKEL